MCRFVQKTRLQICRRPTSFFLTRLNIIKHILKQHMDPGQHVNQTIGQYLDTRTLSSFATSNRKRQRDFQLYDHAPCQEETIDYRRCSLARTPQCRLFCARNQGRYIDAIRWCINNSDGGIEVKTSVDQGEGDYYFGIMDFNVLLVTFNLISINQVGYMWLTGQDQAVNNEPRRIAQTIKSWNRAVPLTFAASSEDVDGRLQAVVTFDQEQVLQNTIRRLAYFLLERHDDSGWLLYCDGEDILSDEWLNQNMP